MRRQMNKERLLKLAEIMERVVPDNYDQNVWLDPPEYISFDGESDGITEPVTPIKHNRGKRIVVPDGFCGTAACVLGHAASHPDFIKQGLEMALSYFKDHNDEYAVLDLEIRLVGSNGAVITDSAFESGERFFGLSKEQSAALFDDWQANWSDESDKPDPRGFYTFFADEPGQEVTPKIVARAIRAVVETDGGVIRLFENGDLEPKYQEVKA